MSDQLLNTLSDTVDLTRTYVKILQDEIMTNAQFRGKTEQVLLRIQEDLTELKDVVISGNDLDEPITIRINKIEYDINAINKSIESFAKKMEDIDKDKKEENIIKKTKFLDFLIQNGLVLLSWIGIAGYTLYQNLLKK